MEIFRTLSTTRNCPISGDSCPASDRKHVFSSTRLLPFNKKRVKLRCGNHHGNLQDIIHDKELPDFWRFVSCFHNPIDSAVVIQNQNNRLVWTANFAANSIGGKVTDA